VYIKRTHYCGQVGKNLIGENITVCGWVHRRRDHGNVIFIDIRDRSGILQVVFDPSNFENASKIRNEYVVGVSGKVRKRPEGMENSKIPTGEVELEASHLEIFSESLPLPFAIDDECESNVDESIRLKYRYIDLRRPFLQRNLRIRHEFLKSTRSFYFENGFWEIETPILYKSTPEGARDYVVPSRVNKGQFYALPQSPQTLKQLCMLGGIDRYVQIARCFRDEDLRADRQPEFTQIDVEMSFITENDIFNLHERLIERIWKDVLNEHITIPFPRINYYDALNRFGSDKPDLRNSLELFDITRRFEKTSSELYRNVISSGGIIKCLSFEEKISLSRSELDSLGKKLESYGIEAISWIRVKSDSEWQGPHAKFFDDSVKREILHRINFKFPSMIFLVLGKEERVNIALSFLRDLYGKKYNYFSSGYKFAWIIDFPLFVYDSETQKLYAAHHPFTSPKVEDLNLFFNTENIAELLKVRANAYDLVLNGYEIGGGSLRIFKKEIQTRMFKLLGLSDEEVNERFGFFIRALQYGCPPHGGIALGVDRIAMLLAGANSIRDVIAFPKTQKAACLMSEAPSSINEEQLKELGIKIEN